ncbi:dehydrogenase [Sesbania bispinosa]|nr:dehydrogenase [Sesbania bispinosa]
MERAMVPESNSVTIDLTPYGFTKISIIHTQLWSSDWVAEADNENDKYGLHNHKANITFM